MITHHGKLILKTGNEFIGHSFGAETNVEGEIVFQTGMVGYPEALTDPSYRGQILVLTYPLIGNYGVPSEKELESKRIQVSGLIISQYDDNYQHWNALQSLAQWLKKYNVPGLCDIDTRELTKIIRESSTHAHVEHGVAQRAITGGTIDGFLMMNDNSKEIIRTDTNVVSRIKSKIYNPSGNLKVLAIDCGMKKSQISYLLKNSEVSLKIVSWDYNFLDEECDRLFISNGPGDPMDCLILIQRLTTFMETRSEIAIFGICLGHQLLALAAGMKTYKMKYGNRGHNIPCQLVGSQRCYMTSQNHGYAVDTSTLPDGWNQLFINLNDGSNEGIYHQEKPWLSVQFHPEGNAGPEDTNFLFDMFLKNDFSDLFVPKIEIEKIIGNQKILILGSGGLTIGQSGEFDYSGSQAIKAYKEECLTTILVNPNIATVQTSPGFADKVYFLPINSEFVTKIIKIERPKYVALSFGGQTALNCGIELFNNGILEKYGIEILGSSIETIIKTEDRKKFKEEILSIGESVPEGFIANNYDEAYQKALSFGFPLLIRSAYTLGGLGSGFANNPEELEQILETVFSSSQQVIIDKSLKGWKEVEYEIVRDKYDNCISVCNMENLDPLGIHTGESIVVAPSQTLSNREYFKLRGTAIKTAKHLGIIGECNIQYALDPHSENYHIIEVNARLSRSSALASKATGYPLAYIAAKLGLGYSLTELKNKITQNTTACFEPSLDYCVVKVPRWDLKKFPLVELEIGSSMKSIGEVMAISRSFEEAFQKAIRMANEIGWNSNVMECTEQELINPTYQRIFAIANGLYHDTYSVEKMNQLTGIDLWFLKKLKKIQDYAKFMEITKLTPEILLEAKKLGFTDQQIAFYTRTTELLVRKKRLENHITPFVKQIDTVAAEFPCQTNYLYTTYHANCHDIEFNQNPVIILGSGVYKIGSSVEFDWCSVNAIRELRKLNQKVAVINCNPETVSTDYDEANRLYFDELTFETVMDIYQLEKSQGIILSMGGQIPNNIAMSLYRQNVNVIGTSPEMIDKAENRYKFSRMLDQIKVNQPQWKELTSIQEAKDFCHKVGYPCLIRPSYVLSGAAMNVAHSDKDLEEYLNDAVAVSKDYPVVISKFIMDAKEIEVDAVAKNGEVKLIAISEHIENAGVHSGDATLVLPAQDLTPETTKKIKSSVYKIAKSLNINGPFNIQFIAIDDQVKFIECNLRVSRTFPFISKTLDINFIEIATQIMMNLNPKIPQKIETNKIGVKVPQFSFNRLKLADIGLGVEMHSTGEVACFGKNIYQAYLKAIQATGIKLPKKSILLAIGSFKFKQEFLESVKTLEKLEYNLYGSRETSDYYRELGINVKELLFNSDQNNILDYLADNRIELVINISRESKYRFNVFTNGYKIRRKAVDHNIPVITDIKVAKLLVNSIKYDIENNWNNYIDITTDCFTSYKTIRLPGLIDTHVHVREPGQEYKEDWETCTKAALAGGFTMIGAMPNTQPGIVDSKTLTQLQDIASKKAYCDYGLYLGANQFNASNIHQLADQSLALKMYLNQTFGDLLLNRIEDWMEHLKNWPENKPICVHAESQTLPALLHLANLYKKRIHVCHVARKEEIEIIKISKSMGINITCEVTPHHLFLSQDDLEKLGALGNVCPPLQTKEDQKALWDNMDIIDCFATDHAPHLIEEKEGKNTPGFPGLETALPLLLTAVKEGKLTIDDIIEKYYTNPRKIFNLPEQPDTYLEVDLEKPWIIPEQTKYSKSGWTPFAGKKVYGLIRRVVLRGKVVYTDGEIIGNPGFGKNLLALKHETKEEEIKLDEIEPIEESKKIELKLNNIISVDQFDRTMLRALFKKAHEMKILVKEHGVLDLLQNRVMASIFYEPSTRTRCSFSVAMQRLGGKVIDIASDMSSAQKGESLEDFVRSLECYADCIVLRSPEKNSAYRASQVLSKPIINAGDGTGEHPTQALLDIFTIREERGTVNGLTITMVGDLKNGRTVHSLSKLLALYDVRLNYVSPPSLRMPTEIIEKISKINPKIEQKEYGQIEEVMETTDVLYMTRIQKERFSSQEEYLKLKDCYQLVPQSLTKSKSNLVLMHPLPRIDEISPDIDNDPRAAYFRQVENGLYMRMALLQTIMGSI